MSDLAIDFSDEILEVNYEGPEDEDFYEDDYDWDDDYDRDELEWDEGVDYGWDDEEEFDEIVFRIEN